MGDGGLWMTGGRAVAEGLSRLGVRHVFNVPGESYLAVLDGFHEYPGLSLITNRQEGGACFMAEAYAKATGQVGVCMVTRGPGATNASAGVHCARQDSTPLVLLVGQVPRHHRGRESFQEVDYAGFFGTMAKWVAEIERPEDVPATLSRAFHLARQGRPGPVVVSLPEDMLSEEASMEFPVPAGMSPPHPGPEDVNRVAEALAGAARPVLLAGGGIHYSQAAETLAAFAEKYCVPVITAWRRNGVFPNSHRHYAGNLAMGHSPARQLAADADLLLVVGCRLSEITTGGYALPAPGCRVIQVDIDPDVLGRHFTPEPGITSDARLLLEALLDLPAAPPPGRTEYIEGAHNRHGQYATPRERATSKVSYERVMAGLASTLPADAIITVDAGNFSGYLQRYHSYPAPECLLGPTVGAMGYGLPAAIAAKLAFPERVVVGTSGDGGFLMTGQELATACQYGVPIIHLVFNNFSLGTIRMHQERSYRGRVLGTELVNPDFAAYARAFGALGFTVRSSDEFLPALREALAETRSGQGRPAVLDIHTDLEHISMDHTLDDLRRNR